MRVAISGIAGFLGSHLAERFSASGHQVSGMDIIHPLEAWRLRGIPHLDYHWGPIGESLYSMPPVDLFIHAAGITGPRFARDHPHFTAKTNILDTVDLMETIRRTHWAERVIHISTFSAYGPNPYGRPLLETDPLRPSTDYGCSKAAQEIMMLGYALRGDIPVVILRMASMYGERERRDQLLTTLLTRALHDQPITLDGGGYQTRDVIYVGNAVDAIATLLQWEDFQQLSGEVFNISSGKDISIRQLAEQCIAFAGMGTLVDGPARVGEEGSLCLDSSKAEDTLPYQPTVPFSSGFLHTARWVQSQISSPLEAAR